MPIDRSFLEVDAERLDDLGFLDTTRSPRLRPVGDLLDNPVGWVLGRPWIGKSTVAQALAAALRTASPSLPGVGSRVCLTRLGAPDARDTTPPTWWDRWIDGTPEPAVWLVD